MDRRTAPQALASVALAFILAGCGVSPTPTPAGSPAPPATAAPTVAPTAGPTEAPTSSPTPTPTPAPGLLRPGSVAVTVSDQLVVRSQPRVSDDSTIYRPYLPTGTELLVIGGPVAASGYRWYHVTPIDVSLDGGVTEGWVAVAARDGTPWVAALEGPLADLALAKSSVPRASAPASAAKTAAASINAFGLDLYRRLLADTSFCLAKENVVFSPTSIVIALAMARAGAKDETATQIDAVLHTSGWDELGTGLNALDRALASRSGTFEDLDGNKLEVLLRLANAPFVQRDLPIVAAYLDALASAFGAGLRLVDYKADPEAARQTINAWVKKQTSSRIPELLLPPDLDDTTRVVLVNALYLKAPWLDSFRVEDTKPGRFTRLDGSRVSVPMMSLVECSGGCHLPYAAGAGWRAVELPFLRDMYSEEPAGLAMTVIVPDDLAAFEKQLAPKLLAGITRALLAGPPGGEGGPDDPGTVYDVRLTMPRFGVETRFDLAKALSSIGMPLAFSPATADFSGIASPPEGPLYISKVIHQANIDVDEKGTEAAAATAIVMMAGGGPNTIPITFTVDRPFLFLLRDTQTGAVLFMGRVVDPSAT